MCECAHAHACQAGVGGGGVINTQVVVEADSSKGLGG